jgi:putative ABC transport system permease protein
VHVFTEAGLLAAVGGCIGVLLALGGVYLFQLTHAGAIPRVDEIAIEGRVLLFAVGLVLVVTVSAGLGPVLHASRNALPANLAHAGRGTNSQRLGHEIRRFLIGFEVALSVVLLTGAGLLLRTFQQLHTVDLGYETRGVVRFSLSHTGELEQVRDFYRTLEENIGALPGVESVGSIYGAPLGPAHTTAEVRPVDKPSAEPGREKYAGFRAVTPGYLRTAGIRVVRGRGFTQRDGAGPETVAVVNEAFVRENFPGEEPLGKRVRMMTDFGYGMPIWTIVGVVGDIRSEAVRRPPISEIYVPQGQVGTGFMTVTVRGTADVEGLLPGIRAEVLALDPRMPLRGVGTIESTVRRELAPTRFFMTAGLLFASLALILAAVGLYGVLGYLVTQRTHEVGVRVALGARAGSIVRMVVVEGMRIALIGAVVGYAASLWSVQLLESLLFSVDPWDAWTFAIVLIVVFVTAFTASMIPALRASQVDPIDALRAE